jgi:hypothetical protein
MTAQKPTLIGSCSLPAAHPGATALQCHLLSLTAIPPDSVQSMKHALNLLFFKIPHATPQRLVIITTTAPELVCMQRNYIFW